MMRRCIFELSSRRSLFRLPSRCTTQMPYFLLSRKGISASSRPNVPTKKPSETNNKPAESGSLFPKFVVATVAVGAAVLAAYQTGFLGKLKVKEEEPSVESISSDISKEVPRDVKNLKEVEKEVGPDRLDLGGLSGREDGVEKSKDGVDVPHLEESVKVEGDSEVQDGLNVTLEEDGKDEQQGLPSLSEVNVASDEQNSNLFEAPPSEEKEGLGNVSSGVEQNEGVSDLSVPQEAETKGITHIEPEVTQSDHVNLENLPEGSPINNTDSSGSLLDEYFIREKDQGSSGTSLDGEGADPLSFSKEKETSIVGGEELKDAYISKDGKLVLDFLQAIHEAEKRQAELDAHVLAEEKRMLKEKYEKELKDARARQLMYAEEAALLDKELNKERVKAAATVKSHKEKAEENLRMELQRKEEEIELQLKKVQELAKAELAAAIASEKAAQIEKMAEANLHINALCMAFYARSEEARQSQSVHKLALGALALEDALSKGLPIQAEIAAMQTYLESIGRDSLIDMALSSLPEEALKHGTDTKLQLNWKFDALKGMLRHYSLIPPGGGGMLAHGLAHVASSLKMREDHDSGDGIECVINRVERFLAEGRLAEAADALEAGVSGSEAQEIIGDWVRQARNRAITEQALSLVQSYATSISLR